MKPPRRPRLAPARFVTGPGAAAAAEGAERPREPWSVREKRALLAALRAQAALGLPELQARPVRERLPRRSEAEIRAFLVRLRGRAAREAARSQFPQRRAPPAPIEVWLEVAQALGGGALEEATAAAFSQVLTLAGTEPLTLLRSAPPPPPGAEGGAEGGDPSPTPGDPPAAAPPPFAVDFRRLYRYLGGLCRGGRGPAPPPHESAVLLALLGALPRELGALDSAGLRAHLRRAYGALTAPHPDPPAPQPAPQPDPLAPPAPQPAPPAPQPAPSTPTAPQVPPPDPQPDPPAPQPAPPAPQPDPPDPQTAPPGPQPDPLDPPAPQPDPPAPQPAPPAPQPDPLDPPAPQPDPPAPQPAPPAPQPDPLDPPAPQPDPPDPQPAPPTPPAPQPALLAPPAPQPAPSTPTAPQVPPPAPQPPPPAPRTPPPGGWRGVGLCPLNPFLVPLRLLARAGPPG